MPFGEPQLDTKRRQDSPPSMVLVGKRSAEQGHEAVSEKLVNRPLVPVNFLKGILEEPA